MTQHWRSLWINSSSAFSELSASKEMEGIETDELTYPKSPRDCQESN